MSDRPPRRARNDVRQYDDLVDHWWRTDGAFAALHWLAESRAALVPAPPAGGGRLLDVACGGGLLAPHLDPRWQHVGIDLVSSGLRLAALHGVLPVQGDAALLPFADAVFDVVVAGEVLEHVVDLDTVVAEVCRVLAPEGTVVVDTIAATRWARVSMVTVAERLPGGPPRRCHDPALFVDPHRLQRIFGEHGVRLKVRGLRPDPLAYARFALTRRGRVSMRPTRSLSSVYQGVGEKTATH
ncbi:MAG: methyltransferase domain-containing protein [Euzebyales bacterium]|nr:methyltransferase domain-containing protein [Euzebyales bacterium]